MAKFFERLISAPKSLAVIGLGMAGSSPWWYPILEHVASGSFGPDAQKWATLIVAILGIIGWAVPQKSIPK